MYVSKAKSTPSFLTQYASFRQTLHAPWSMTWLAWCPHVMSLWWICSIVVMNTTTLFEVLDSLGWSWGRVELLTYQNAYEFFKDNKGEKHRLITDLLHEITSKLSGGWYVLPRMPSIVTTFVPSGSFPCLLQSIHHEYIFPHSFCALACIWLP
jgi:hypothetical protein